MTNLRMENTLNVVICSFKMIIFSQYADLKSKNTRIWD